jgi:hypothetical protein
MLAVNRSVILGPMAATAKTSGRHRPASDGGREAGSVGGSLPLRVGFAGERGRELLGPGVAFDRDEDDGRLDALVIDSAPGISRGEVERAARAARSAGAVVIGLGDGSASPVWAGLVDAAVGAVDGEAARSVVAAPPVDIRSDNPSLFAASGVAGYSSVVRPGATGDAVAGALPLLAAAGREPVVLRAPDEVVARLDFPDGVAPGPRLGDGRAMLRFLHKRLGVIDHPSFHASEWERAGWIVRLCAAGVPVVVEEPSPGLRDLLGAELFELLVGSSPRQLADLDARERLSVALRRVALREHSVTARWRQICAAAQIALPPRPMVSVIFATRREEWLAHGLAQIARQTYEPRELVVCLHGSDFAPDVEERIRAAVSGAVKVVRVDSELTLGDALNAGVEASEGELVTKMDDDDYYNVDHLWDLALACEYSGADLVGKAAEFVYLEEIDVTVRQITHDVDTRLAGGGMMLRKGPLVELGGWPQRTRAEDLALIRMYDSHGRRIHRIPPLGYILNRHGRGHTWRPAVDYFLFRSERTWRGLRFDVTAIEPVVADLRP